jgi:hypothetical protein
MREFKTSTEETLTNRSNAAGSEQISPLSAGQAGFGGMPEGKGVGVKLLTKKKGVCL